ncbi:hypothetical protein L1987_48894 [Smallanthus sonchifolius]|uniref:Uncharacterized protein n=1 Tax=Smallanthus sonchifolius TaxID=185202 RepID=A0ACB9FUU9_9ASTR|nr:hypothetical protein L1987_48894 [Smallanthus sonchifolius]
MNHYSCSIDLFRQMGVIRVPFDTHTMNIVIKCCSQLNHTNHGFAVLGYGLKQAVAPDVCTYNTLLNGLVREDRILEAELLFKKLIKQDVCEPDVVMYSTMIKGLCKFGLKPDVVTYSTMLQGLFLAGQCGAARDLLNEMRAHNHFPNTYTYGIIFDGLCNNRLADEALSLFRSIGDKKNQEHDDMVKKIVEDMDERGFSLDATSLSLLLDHIAANHLMLQLYQCTPKYS